MEGRGRGPWRPVGKDKREQSNGTHPGRARGGGAKVLKARCPLSVFQSDCLLHHVSQQQGVPGKMLVRLKLVTVSLFPF